MGAGVQSASRGRDQALGGKPDLPPWVLGYSCRPRGRATARKQAAQGSPAWLGPGGTN